MASRALNSNLLVQTPYFKDRLYLIAGKLNFRIDTEWHWAVDGDSWSIPENAEHEVEIVEDSVVRELFSPIRPDYPT